MKMIMEKVPLLPTSAKKDTLSSDLLRSEPHSEKGTLFWEFLDKHVNTYRESVTQGVQYWPCLFHFYGFLVYI